ncbi:MAG: hypothetical protein HYY04_16920 [Chloroflexi bacterium]|nr:hypothetical protein [Chloroflexota bacterium]
MTNTLHRRGTPEDLGHDFVVFATIHGKADRPEVVEALRRFREIVARHDPVNRPEPNRGTYKDINTVEPSPAERGPSATFDDYAKVAAVIADLEAADLGISVNVSGPLGEVACACQAAGFTRHSVEHSLGIFGNKDRLPTADVLEISTLCGHGMVSHNISRRMIDLVKQGKLTIDQASEYLARPCTCGVFNKTRSKQVLDRARKLG